LVGARLRECWLRGKLKVILTDNAKVDILMGTIGGGWGRVPA
jgi:hypothetical protein